MRLIRFKRSPTQDKPSLPNSALTMPKLKTKSAIYAVKVGRVPGLYNDWASEVEPLVKNFPGALHKKFTSYDLASEWLYGKSSKVIDPTLPAITGPSKGSPTKPNGFHPYTDKPLSKGPLKEQDVQDESGWDVVYTDGSCTGNGGPNAKAGVGVWWGHNDLRNISERCPGDQTNNRAELIAIIRALETTPPSDKPLLIKTDLSYSISCIRDWLPRWRVNKFRTSDDKPVKNIEVILFLSHLLSDRPGVRLQHIKGHAGHEGNEGADAVAQRGTWLPAMPDRDWTLPEEDEDQLMVIPHPELVPNKQVVVCPTQVTEISVDDYSDYADLLLSPEEMERMEKEQDF